MLLAFPFFPYHCPTSVDVFAAAAGTDKKLSKTKVEMKTWKNESDATGEYWCRS